MNTAEEFVTGEFVTIEGVPYYKINNAQELNPFFIQVASSSDLWLFMSSQGGVTAGRQNAKNNLFPYETEDRLHRNQEAGSKTIVKIGNQLWQPFEVNTTPKYVLTQNIYKGYYGDSVMIEEINHDLAISYRYKYEMSEQYGLVKTSTFAYLGEGSVEVEILDGVGGLLPYGVNPVLQGDRSTLVDAYRAAELLEEQLGVYSLTTQINDDPHPIEVLKANIAYTTLGDAKVYLNSKIVSAFYKNQVDRVEPECYGSKCGYYVLHKQVLKAHQTVGYSMVFDVGYDHSKLEELREFVLERNFACIHDDIAQGTQRLKEIVAQADGVQQTGDKVACAHHYLNTLYNVMRGGTFEESYQFNYDDFLKFVVMRSKKAASNTCLLEQISVCKTMDELKTVAEADKTMYRLALEYMPLSFSRRHGDPSRPWNQFNIVLKDEEGHKVSSYEGNWRDIFQNWEALGLSFPGYYEHMIAKFVNASTADGFNPYRINTKGIEWEKIEEDNPFSGFGYWGDHQIIYLLRLLKGMQNHFPEQLNKLLALESFTYAEVPYLIKDYDSILKDSKNTIEFDYKRDAAIEARCISEGSDGKLLHKGDDIYTVTLMEKLFVPLLSKISNLLVGGGIWMNTQRPEWNDANNAIVGIGLSMVTVYHVKAYIDYMLTLLEAGAPTNKLSKEVVTWLEQLTATLTKYSNGYAGHEKEMLDEMGYAFAAYRKQIYTHGLSNKQEVTADTLRTFLEVCDKAITYTIKNNKEEVYATYNLLNDDYTVSPMGTMLEGQSAVISSGYLVPEEIIELFEQMEEPLLDTKLKAHTLYPVKPTKRFVDKNKVAVDCEPIKGLLHKDCHGQLHFDSAITTAQALIEKIGELRLPVQIIEQLMEAFEANFQHKKFTGRSQVMYKFEGIGCIYWHQNAKLALATLEEVVRAYKEGKDATELYKTYKQLTNGFIYRKTPLACNAIPVEPYSHSSYNKTSEQPGMTGQVKESVIMRRIELGVLVENGEVIFKPWFISQDEFEGQEEIDFTIYGVPVKYVRGDQNKVMIDLGDETRESNVLKLDESLSKELFLRTGKVQSIIVTLAQ